MGFKTTRDRLKELSVKPSKERGQNFLVEPWALDQILTFGNPLPGENLVEIGPGLGAMTGELYAIAPLTVIEVEEAFCKKLKEVYPDLTVINEDIRAVNFEDIGTDLTVFGNLPYSLSTEIVFHLIGFRHCIKRAVFLLQKEFVERMASAPGKKSYSTLSINCQLHARVTAGPVIKGDCFHPSATVDSRVVSLEFYQTPKVEVKSPFDFQRLVAAAFYKRRKKLLNSIAASGSFPGEDLNNVCAAAGIDPEKRGEMLSIEEFARLANAYADLNPSGV